MARAKRLTPGDRYHHQLIRETRTGDSTIYDYLIDRGIKRITISKWNLGAVFQPMPGHEGYYGWIVIPYYSRKGIEIGLRFRRPPWDDRKPKYMGGGGHVFGVRFAMEPVVYITEGEFDALVCHQLGFKAVAIPGAEAWQHEWRWLFAQCDEVVIVPDADGRDQQRDEDGRVQFATGGVAFRMRVNGSLKGMPPAVRTVRLPDKEDVSSLYIKDPKLLRSLLKGG